MGTIYYGGGETPIHIEDRALAHLKVVIATKLRRRESFTLSWQHPDDEPRGRTTIWLHPSIPLRFVFDEPETPQLSRKWIEELAHSANTTGGIQLVPEQLDTPPLHMPADTAVSMQAEDQAAEEEPVVTVAVDDEPVSAADAGSAQPTRFVPPGSVPADT